MGRDIKRAKSRQSKEVLAKLKGMSANWMTEIAEGGKELSAEFQ